MTPGDRSHEELRDDLAAYALGALPDGEARTLEIHLEECEPCRELLRWLAPAVDVLPASVEQRRPPDALRERLLDTVRAESEPQVETAETRPRRRWALRLPQLRPALAFAAVAVLAVGIAVGYELSDSGPGETPAGPVVSAVEPLGPERIEGTLARDGELATLRLERMPELRRDQVYEVWIERDGALEPSTLFVPDAERDATAAIRGSLDGADRILVTAEPRGGSDEPTGAPLLQARL